MWITGGGFVYLDARTKVQCTRTQAWKSGLGGKRGQRTHRFRRRRPPIDLHERIGAKNPSSKSNFIDPVNHWPSSDGPHRSSLRFGCGPSAPSAASSSVPRPAPPPRVRRGICQPRYGAGHAGEKNRRRRKSGRVPSHPIRPTHGAEISCMMFPFSATNKNTSSLRRTCGRPQRSAPS